MTDFHQEGIITTLHALYDGFDREEYLESLEKKLVEYSRHVSICLLLPCLFSEIENPPVLDRIINEIRKVNYLHCVIVALGGAQDEAQFKEAKNYFGRLSTSERDVKVVWVEGPRIRQVFDTIKAKEIPTGIPSS